MSPEMYTLIDPTPFHHNISLTTATPSYPIKYNPEGVIVPYTRKEKSTIDVKFSMVKETWKKSVKHAMACLMRTWMMSSKWHQQLPHRLQDGI
jgi:hypothetical protein